MNIIKSILEISLFSSIIICIVLMLRSVWSGKINHKVLSFLWILVIVRLIMPITIDSPIHLDSIFPKDAVETPVEPIVAEPINEIEVLPEAEYILPNAVIHNLDTTLEVDVVQSSLWSKIASYIKSLDLSIAAFVVWLSVAAFIFILNIAEYFRFNYLVTREKHTRNAKLSRILRRSKAILNINKEISIYECTYISTPATFRCVRPVILVPADFTRHIKDNKLQMIILHELCHIKRGDIFKNFIWLLAKSMHWFNPLVWIAYRKYISDIELFCDEMVLKYISEDESFTYSQSLIDVIKLSNSDNQLPVALSFCQDKNKLKERVQNMIEPKKKLKSASIVSLLLATIMIIGCFTTACQSTPENMIVDNRSDDKMENPIPQVDSPTTDEPQDDVVEEAEEPELRVTDTEINDAGTVTVNIDAEVINNQPDNIPVAKIALQSLTPDEIERMVQAFFGNTVLYDRKVATKADYEIVIEYIRNKMENDDALLASDIADATGITDLDELRELEQEALDTNLYWWENAPEERPIISSFDDITSDMGIGAFIDTGKGYMGYVGAGTGGATFTSFNDNINYYMNRSSFLNCASYINPNTDNAEFQNAKLMAIQMIQDMGIEGVQYGDAYLKQDDSQTLSQTPNPSNGREYYVFCFEKTVGDSTLDHTLCSGNLSYYKDPIDTGVEYTGHDEDEVFRSYEKLELWIEKDTFVQFIYRYPMQVSEIVNNSVTINIDYTQAINIAKQHAYIWYPDMYSSSFSEMNINITKIELILARTRDKDTDEFIVVPAWNFSGKLQGKLNEDGAFNREEQVGDWLTRYGNWGHSDTLITVNALDGTIIDMEHGH